jgi:hypothetical protein
MQRFCIPLHLLYGFRFIGFNGRGWLGSRAILLLFYHTTSWINSSPGSPK